MLFFGQYSLILVTVLGLEVKKEPKSKQPNNLEVFGQMLESSYVL